MAVKLFISYRSTDSKKVDPIVARLRSIGYEIWFDKDSIPVGQDWWEAICEGIQSADVFLFMVSSESVKSFACQAELSFAHKLNLPIIPFVIEGEWLYNTGGKYTISFWDDIPSELQDENNRAQFLFYEGVNFVDKLETGIQKLLAKKLPRFRAEPLPDPRHASDSSNNATVIYDEAYDFAYRGEFGTAETLFRKLVTRNDPVYGKFSYQWVELLREYQQIKTMAALKSTRKIAISQWTIFVQKFPNDFIDETFDPSRIAELLNSSDSIQNEIPMPKPIQIPVAESKPPAIVKPSKPKSIDLMPQPFAWIEIPKKAYSMAKYPVTNAQFAEFIKADGYSNSQWWTKEGWQKCQEGWHYNGDWKASGKAWTEPRFWADSEWNGVEQPVVGVSWFEAMAFCVWLSETTGENIMLPTEEQWQYAAQGDDGRDYPWGKQWDGSRCNNNVDRKGIGKTSPVRQYEGKGDSPFGVVDMAGNVWEWCLTDYGDKTNDFNSIALFRVLRGGSWDELDTDCFRCDARFGGDPRYWYFGFRLSRSF